MRKITARKLALILAVLPLFSSGAAAVILNQTMLYEHPVRAIKGRVTALGQVIPATVWVDVYDNAQVCLDNSMPPVDQRKKQAKVASGEPNNKGEFSIKHLPKGLYEVEIGNHGMGGYYVQSVLVNVDPNGTNDRICVDLGLEGAGRESTVAKCSAKLTIE